MNRMPAGEPSNPVGDPETMLDRLQGLLEQQLVLVHQGRLDAATELCDQTDQCVRGITDARTGDPTCGTSRLSPPSEGSNSAGRWRHVEQLYRDLCLALAAEQAETSAALNAIRRGKRMLKIYSGTGLFRR